MAAVDGFAHEHDIRQLTTLASVRTRSRFRGDARLPLHWLAVTAVRAVGQRAPVLPHRPEVAAGGITPSARAFLQPSRGPLAAA